MEIFSQRLFPRSRGRSRRPTRTGEGKTARRCRHHCSLRGPGRGQSSLRAGRLSFAPSVASWPAPPSTYAHWSLGRGGLSCLLEQPVGQPGRGASREGMVEAEGGRPFYPWSSGEPTARRPRMWRPSRPSGRAPDTDSSAELEGTSEPSWFRWGRGAQRGAVACPGSDSQPAAEPDLRPEPWSPRDPAFGEDQTNCRHRGALSCCAPVAEAGSRPSSSAA